MGEWIEGLSISADVLFSSLSSIRDLKEEQTFEERWDYSKLNEMTKDLRLPAMIVHLDILQQNIRNYCEIARKHGKTIRLATKSVRVPDLIQLILDIGEGTIKGLMCFSVAEARFLATKFNHDDLMIGYPAAQHDLHDAWSLVMDYHKDIQLQVDCKEHVDLLERFWAGKIEETGRGSSSNISVCIDMDCSYDILGIHLGANRSPLRNLQSIIELIQYILSKRYVRLVGVMGYEAQISGVQNVNPYDPTWLRWGIQTIQKLSAKDVIRKRQEVASYLKSIGYKLQYFNGGGSGSLEQTASEAAVTEVTAGSGFLQSHLFDYFLINKNQCAFCYGLRVTRAPCPGIVTCQSGGFPASGKASQDKYPIPFLPKGAKISPEEGFGEVQTPIILPNGIDLKIGDAVFSRPAKAGEIAERFPFYYLMKENKVVKEMRTYRGFGECFY